MSQRMHQIVFEGTEIFKNFSKGRGTPPPLRPLPQAGDQLVPSN